MFELFGLEEIEILCEVLWNHLRVVNWDENVIIFLILSVKWTIVFVTWYGFREYLVLFFEFLVVHVRVALSVSRFCFDEVCELLAKDSEIHLAVKINYYIT